MRRVVLSTIAAIVAAAGTYHLVLATDASALAATIAVIAAVGFTLALIPAAGMLAGMIGFDRIPAAFAAAIGVSIIVMVIAVLAAIAVVAGVTIAAVVFAPIAVAGIASATAITLMDQVEYLRYRWAFAAYATEALTIFIALTIGNVTWSIAIACGGVAALFALWRLASPANLPTIAAPAPYPNGG